MFNKKTHLIKSILGGLTCCLITTINAYIDRFPNWNTADILMLLISTLGFALLLQIIPLIFYLLFSLFTKNKENSLRAFRISFNITFWLWLVLLSVTYLITGFGHH